MSALVGLLIINLTYFIYHFGFKRHLKFQSALDILNSLQQAQKENKRLGLHGWFYGDEDEYLRARKVYSLKFHRLTKDGVKITEIK